MHGKFADEAGTGLAEPGDNHKPRENSAMNAQMELIERLVNQGGPSKQDYAALDAWIADICRLIADGRISPDEIEKVQAAFGDAFSARTLQGFAFAKPHGYAGDFEIIDRIYREYVTPDPGLTAWDAYWQRHSAPRAVRNRKHYFLDQLRSRAAALTRPMRVLNVASGPGRDMLEYFETDGVRETHFHCLDQDPEAIAYAANLCRQYAHWITFTRTDVLRFRAREKYDLVWSAGLFDYFEDRLFRVILKRLLAAVAPGGELIIGNFAPNNPSQHWMALCNWVLHYRDADELVALAEDCGVPRSCISIGMEPEGINLFLHIRPEPSLVDVAACGSRRPPTMGMRVRQSLVDNPGLVESANLLSRT